MSEKINNSCNDCDSVSKRNYPMKIEDFYVVSDKFFGITVKGNEKLLFSKKFLTAYTKYCSTLKYPPHRTMFFGGYIWIYWFSVTQQYVDSKKVLEQLYNLVLDYAKTIECFECYGVLDDWIEQYEIDHKDEEEEDSYPILSKEDVDRMGIKYFDCDVYTMDIADGKYHASSSLYNDYKGLAKWIKSLKEIKRKK